MEAPRFPVKCGSSPKLVFTGSDSQTRAKPDQVSFQTPCPFLTSCVWSFFSVTKS